MNPEAQKTIPKLEFDIKKLVRWNFLSQFFLSAVSWGVVFLATHNGLARGQGLNPASVALLIGLFLSAYSVYLSFQYVRQVSENGVETLEGWEQMTHFFDHLTYNFVGAVATLIALQAQVGTTFASVIANSTARAFQATAAKALQGGTYNVEALAQAATNILTSHVVSMIFLVMLIRKITTAYQKFADWDETFRNAGPGKLL